MLWELAHLPKLPCSLIQQALEEHLTILSDAYAVKEAIKRSYIIKCIEDIKRVGLLFYLFQNEMLSSLDVTLSLKMHKSCVPSVSSYLGESSRGVGFV